MANKEKEEVKKKSTLVHDTICLFMITLISGLLLGAGYTITKKPIAAQEEKNKQEAYEAVYQGASFEEDSALNKSLEKFNKDLAAGKVLEAVVEIYSNTSGIRDLEQAAEHLAANALYQIEVDGLTEVVFDAEKVKKLFL